MPKPTKQEIIAVLCALYIVCGESIHCHKRPETIRKKVSIKIGTKTVKRALEILCNQGLVWRHGGRNTYGLTKEGIRLAKMICRELFEGI